MNSNLKFTDRQKQALQLLGQDYTDILLVGGSQSGKSLVYCAWIIRMVTRWPGLRCLIGRLKYDHAKSSIWTQTLLPLLKAQVPQQLWKENKTDPCNIQFVNGSWILLGGFDENERMEKILGHSYHIIYFNEISQLAWKTVDILWPRLSQVIGDLVPKALYDCNPPPRSHWCFSFFIKKKHPVSKKSTKKKIAYLRMNPIHNRENLPTGYIENTLGSLTGNARRRFLQGRFPRPEKGIFKKFTKKNILKDIPACERYIVGVDLITYAAVLIGLQRQRKKDKIVWQAYVLDEWGQDNATASEANQAIMGRWEQYRYQAIIDHNLGKAGTREFVNSRLADKKPGSVEAGIALLQRMFENNELFVHQKCITLIYELEMYHRDDFGRIVAKNDHYIAALRMALFTTLGTKREIEVY